MKTNSDSPAKSWHDGKGQGLFDNLSIDDTLNIRFPPNAMCNYDGRVLHMPSTFRVGITEQGLPVCDWSNRVEIDGEDLVIYFPEWIVKEMETDYPPGRRSRAGPKLILDGDNSQIRFNREACLGWRERLDKRRQLYLQRR